MGINNWISLALSAVCCAGLGFMIFRSLKQLSASVKVVTLKKFNVSVVGSSILVKYERAFSLP